MGLRTVRSAVALLGATALVATFAACGNSGGSSGSSSGAGKTLNVLIGANPQYPQELQA